MKSLAERIAYRAKQEELRKQRNGDLGLPETNGESETEFDANDYLKTSVEKITNGLADLSDEDLNALEETEANGKKRAGVTAAIKKEKDARVSKGSDWSPNNA